MASVLKDKKAKVLDVGAGAGSFVIRLKALGILNAVGVDPYIKETITDSTGDIVRKCHINEVKDQYDFITFNHSLEYMPDFKESLSYARNLLQKNGCCIVRLPIYPSFAWYKYGENWVQFDAPRHVAIFSIQGFAELARDCGLSISHVFDDSNYFQFVGSENIKNRIMKNIGSSLLQRLLNPIRYFIKNLEAEKLNKIGQGDQKCFILKRTNIEDKNYL